MPLPPVKLFPLLLLLLLLNDAYTYTQTYRSRLIYVPCIHAFHADMHSSSLMHTQLHASHYGLHSLSYLHVVQSGVSTL